MSSAGPSSATLTKTSFDPSSGWMKPNPLRPLNHLTVPLGIGAHLRDALLRKREWPSTRRFGADGIGTAGRMSQHVRALLAFNEGARRVTGCLPATLIGDFLGQWRLRPSSGGW